MEWDYNHIKRMESEGKYCAGDITRIITKVSRKGRL
jgi:hypothetical protein